MKSIAFVAQLEEVIVEVVIWKKQQITKNKALCFLQQRALIPATKLNKNVSQESTPKEDSNENPHHLFTLEEDTNVNKQKDCHLPKTT